MDSRWLYRTAGAVGLASGFWLFGTAGAQADVAVGADGQLPDGALGDALPSTAGLSPLSTTPTGLTAPLGDLGTAAGSLGTGLLADQELLGSAGGSVRQLGQPLPGAGQPGRPADGPEQLGKPAQRADQLGEPVPVGAPQLPALIADQLAAEVGLAPELVSPAGSSSLFGSPFAGLAGGTDLVEQGPPAGVEQGPPAGPVVDPATPGLAGGRLADQVPVDDLTAPAALLRSLPIVGSTPDLLPTLPARAA